VTQDPTYPIPCPDCAPTQVLNGTVNGNGYGFVGYFEYGPAANVNGGFPTYTDDTSTFAFAGTNNSPQSFSFDMSNVAGTLTHYTTYHYRIVAFSIWSGVEVDGGDKTFFYP
jgi:hypothetical protein